MDMNKTLLPKCLCGSSRRMVAWLYGLPMFQCPDCGIARQHVPMTKEELSEWYAENYFLGKYAYTHSYEHDEAVAKIRLDKYQLTPGTKLLDVGCGLGAFIGAAVERGIDAWGQDVADIGIEKDRIYRGELADVAFPTDSFDVVTVHDVLEHLIDPIATLREIRRLLKRPGKLIVDFPRFHEPCGAHHWKETEHLWMLTEVQLRSAIVAAGFRITHAYHPIPSKLVVEAEPLPEKRLQILVPAGIGDSWWVMTKLPGFLRTNGFGLPDVWVQDGGGPRRTQPYLRTLPFIHAAGYKPLEYRNPLFREAYNQEGRTIFPGVLGVDYFIAYNGVMRYGRALEEVNEQFGCEWRPKMHISKQATEFGTRMKGAGDYIAVYFAEAGMYRAWLAQFSAAKIAEAVNRMAAELDCYVIIIGASWDRGQVGGELAKQNPHWLNLIGSTTFDQMLGVLKNAKAVFGFPAGNTMLATYFKVPTVLLWNEYFDRRFWNNACPPDGPYRPLDTRNLSVDTAVNAVRDLVSWTE